MTRPLQVRLLGPLEVAVDGAPVGPGGSLRRAVLALLALHAGEVVPVDTLIDGLWGEHPPHSATGVLQTYVSTWRKAFEAAGAGPRIATVGAGYRLDLARGESDLLDVTALTRDARRLADEGRPADARERLEQALAQWRGPVLADLADRPFHGAVTAPVEDTRRRTLEDWAELVLRTGSDDDLATVGAALDQLLAENPWRERAAALLMWTLVRQFRQRDALEVFDRTRRRLDEELGVDPGPALRSMHERVLRQDPGLLVRTGGRARRAARLDSFVGRDDDVRAVHDLLHRVRLVTLTGPGGAGKTRLAEEVAADLAAQPGVDAVVVELASVEDAHLLPGAVAARLGEGPAETLEALVARLAGRRLLLVLDNLEQLEGVGPLVTRLLAELPDLRVLTTSREPLRVAGEHRYEVGTLAVPEPDEADPRRLAASASVALLLDRAAAAGGPAEVTTAGAAAVRDVVRAVDGLPLALEIVAPWLGPLGPHGVLAELRSPLDLPGRSVDAAARHRTLRSAIAWSWDRLTADQQRLLARLSVLRGGGDLDAVRAVGGEDLGTPVPQLVVDLVERHLVRPLEPVAGCARFGLLETVRQYAAERLAADDGTAAAELRAAVHFAGWAVGLAGHGEGPGAGPWLARALADADNLRAAIETLAGAGRTGECLQLTVDAWALWFELGHEREGERRLQAALEAAPADHPARAMGLLHQAALVIVRDRHRARRLVEEALALARAGTDEALLGVALIDMGEFADTEDAVREAALEVFAIAERIRGRPVRYGLAAADALATQAADDLAFYFTYRDVHSAARWQQRSVEAAERSGDPRLLARHLALLAWLHVLQGDADPAAALTARARSLVGTGGTGRWEDTVALASVLVDQLRGDVEAAGPALRSLFEQGLSSGRLLVAYYASYALVDLLVDAGDPAEADAVLRRTEETLGDSDDPRFVNPVRVRRARLLRLAGRAREAVAVLDATATRLPPDQLSPEHVVHLVERALLAGGPEEAWGWVERLEDLSRRTGIAVPPWERRLLAVLPVRP